MRILTLTLIIVIQVLGMEKISEMKMETFTLYFLAYDHTNGVASAEEKSSARFMREGKSGSNLPEAQL